MLKTAGLFLLWLAGSAAAVAVAWTGVAIVDNEIISPAPANTAPDNPGAAELAMESRPTDSDDAGESIGPAAEASGESSTELDAIAIGRDQHLHGSTASGRPPSSASETEATAVGSAAGTSNANRSTSTVESQTTGRATTVDPASTASTASTTRVVVTTSATVRRTSAAPTTVRATTTSPTTSRASTSRTTTSSPTTNRTTTIRTTTSRPTTTAAPPATTTTTQPPTTQASGQTLTFNLVGGSTAISFSSDQVRVLWATPKPGFDVDIGGGSGTRVEFEADHHRTRLDAWWDGGPRTELREEPRD